MAVGAKAPTTVTVTQHAVQRYMKRAPDAEHLDIETARTIMKTMVEEAIARGDMGPDPSDREKRVVPIKVGNEMVRFVLGPNMTTYPGDWAVISVVYDAELGGRSGTGATIGDLVPEDVRQRLVEKTSQPKKVRFIVRITSTKEQYEVQDLSDFNELLKRRQPNPDDVELYERVEVDIRREYVIGPVRRPV